MTLNSNQHYHFSTLPKDDEEILDLIAKLNNAKLPNHAASAVKRDLNRLRKLPSSSSDSAVLRIYLEYVSDLPWSSIDNSELNMLSVRDQLDADHFG